jgi:serine/threonine-protein kinase RsbW
MDTNRTPRCEFVGENLLLHYETSLPADVRRISPLVESVMAKVEEMGCAEGKEFEVETALREALANAIIHGAGQDPKKQVQFLVACDQSRGMLIVVRDPGEGFDPDSIPSPVVGQEIYSTHGRGIYLINQLMDEVHFTKGGTEIVMKKR